MFVSESHNLLARSPGRPNSHNEELWQRARAVFLRVFATPDAVVTKDWHSQARMSRVRVYVGRGLLSEEIVAEAVAREPIAALIVCARQLGLLDPSQRSESELVELMGGLQL